jgi:adenylate cyclase
VSDPTTLSPAGTTASRRRHFIVAIVLAPIIAAALIVAAAFGLLPEAPDRVLYDWRSYYLTSPEPTQRSDIALVLIDEQSLRGYPALSPINRGLMAELVRRIDAAGATVIGLDFLLSRPATETPELINAIKGAKHAKIVLATAIADVQTPDEPADELNEEFAFQERFVAESGIRTGHFYFASEQGRLSLGDQVVRYRMPEGFGNPSRPSFAWAVAEAAGKAPAEAPPSQLITWQRGPGGGTPLFITYSARAHRDENGIPTGDPLPERVYASLAGKIVLIGGALSDRDRHLSPWSVVNQERIPGVEVHAQILAHLIDARWTWELTWRWQLPLLILVFLLGYYLARRWRLSPSDLVRAAVAAVLAVLAAFLLWYFRVMLPTAGVILALMSGLFCGGFADKAFAWLEPGLHNK